MKSKKSIAAPKIELDCRYYIKDLTLKIFYLIGRHPNFPNSKIVAIESHPMGDEKKIFDIDDWEELLTVPNDKDLAYGELREKLKNEIEEIDRIMKTFPVDISEECPDKCGITKDVLQENRCLACECEWYILIESEDSDEENYYTLPSEETGGL